MAAIGLRAFAYFILAALAALVLGLEVNQAPELIFNETGMTERLQSSILALLVILLLFSAWQSHGTRELQLCMAMAFLMFLIRESDAYFDGLLFHGAWKYLALAPLGVATWVFWRNRGAVSEQLGRYAGSSAFGVMLSGFMVLVFSRLFGRAEYWAAIMGESYIRVAKNAAEESTEFLAMVIMFAAVLEWLLVSRIASRRT